MILLRMASLSYNRLGRAKTAVQEAGGADQLARLLLFSQQVTGRIEEADETDGYELSLSRPGVSPVTLWPGDIHSARSPTFRYQIPPKRSMTFFHLCYSPA